MESDLVNILHSVHDTDDLIKQFSFLSDGIKICVNFP